MSSSAVRRNTLVRAVYTTPNTDWPGDRAFTHAYGRATNGAKSRPNNSSDLLSPHILRSICNVQVTKALTGPSANYAVVFDGAVLDSMVHDTATRSQRRRSHIWSVPGARPRSEYQRDHLGTCPSQDHSGECGSTSRSQVRRRCSGKDSLAPDRQPGRRMGLREQHPRTDWAGELRQRILMPHSSRIAGIERNRRVHADQFWLAEGGEDRGC